MGRQPKQFQSAEEWADRQAKEGRDAGVEWEDCQFHDSGIYDGRYWPLTQVHPLSLAADAVRRIEFLAPVVTTMYVTVITGVLSLWFTDVAADPRPDGEQAHMEFASGQGPVPIVLAPGQHRFTVGAGNDAACTATVVFLNREAHEVSR